MRRCLFVGERRCAIPLQLLLQHRLCRELFLVWRCQIRIGLRRVDLLDLLRCYPSMRWCRLGGARKYAQSL